MYSYIYWNQVFCILHKQALMHIRYRNTWVIICSFLTHLAITMLYENLVSKSFFVIEKLSLFVKDFTNYNIFLHITIPILMTVCSYPGIQYTVFVKIFPVINSSID